MLNPQNKERFIVSKHLVDNMDKNVANILYLEKYHQYWGLKHFYRQTNLRNYLFRNYRQNYDNTEYLQASLANLMRKMGQDKLDHSLFIPKTRRAYINSSFVNSMFIIEIVFDTNMLIDADKNKKYYTSKGMAKKKGAEDQKNVINCLKLTFVCTSIYKKFHVPFCPVNLESEKGWLFGNGKKE